MTESVISLILAICVCFAIAILPIQPPQQPGTGHWEVEPWSRCQSSSGVLPYISLDNKKGWPRVGETIEITFFAGDSRQMWLALGDNPNWWGPVGFLPWAIPGTRGCLLGVAPETLSYVGVDRTTVPVYMDPGLVGRDFRMQLLVLDLAANPAGMTTSRVVRMQVGL